MSDIEYDSAGYPHKSTPAPSEPQPATPRCIGYPACDGDLVATPHSPECPAYTEADAKMQAWQDELDGLLPPATPPAAAGACLDVLCRRIDDALAERDEHGSYVPVTRSYLMHLLSEARRALDAALEAQ